QPDRGVRRAARGRPGRPGDRSLPARTRAGHAAGRRPRVGAPGPSPSRIRAGVQRRLLPGAAARRDGRPVSAADVAADTGARLAAADARGLNATLHWSQALLDAEA